MSEWINQCETVLTAFQIATGVPYDFERFSGTSAQLPNSYIVYFLVDDPPKGHSDGKETSHSPRIQISLFYRDKSKILTTPDQLTAAFTAANFLRISEGRIPYVEDTGHYGWRCDFRFYERR